MNITKQLSIMAIRVLVKIRNLFSIIRHLLMIGTITKILIIAGLFLILLNWEKPLFPIVL